MARKSLFDKLKNQQLQPQKQLEEVWGLLQQFHLIRPVESFAETRGYQLFGHERSTAIELACSLRIATIGRVFLDMLREPALCGCLQHVVDIYTNVCTARRFQKTGSRSRI